MKYCTNCGGQHSEAAKFCSECGAAISLNATDSAPKPEITPTSTPADLQSYAVNRAIKNELTTCINCGRPYRADKLISCPACGEPTFGVQQISHNSPSTAEQKWNKWNQGRSENFVNPVPSESASRTKIWLAVGIVIALIFVGLKIGSHSGLPQESGVSQSASTNQSSGHWVSKCRWVQVPNPNYQGSQASVNQSIENGPAYFQEKQCTDQYVSD